MTVLFDYAIALTNLNGVIDKEKVLEIYNKQNKETKSLADIDLLMGKEEKNLEENFVRVEGNYFVHEAIFNVNEINELLAKKADKPYYIPTKKLLLRYTDDEFYEETPESKKVYRMLEKYVESHNANTLEDIFFDVQMSCEMENDPIYIMNYLHDMDVIFPSQKEGLEALSLITDLSNNTRIWSNNGFTPNEIYIQEEKPKLKALPIEPKIGRNDPCHCGSGKKYKKCCLVNE